VIASGAEWINKILVYIHLKNLHDFISKALRSEYISFSISFVFLWSVKLKEKYSKLQVF
jgi:hypothetical protein